ncbi:MAG: tetratricopeptide repeat protein [Candidatus Wallbacteria bacterium]|nr:tetratricopeptide repeat protein [Candidatus Wallbacteria bacterium]
MLLAPAATVAAETVAFSAGTSLGGKLEVTVDGAETRVRVRDSAAAVRDVALVRGARPVALLQADLQGDGKPEKLVVLEEPGSGGYRRRLLLSDDGATTLWESPAQPGAEASAAADGRSFLLSRVLEGERPEGDLPLETRLVWAQGRAVERQSTPLAPQNGWQCLTAGLRELTVGSSRSAVDFLTRAVDSAEGSSEPLGASARHHLSRALLADKQAARAKAMLTGLARRFPESPFAAEAKRTLELFDRTFEDRYQPLVLIVRAEVASSGSRWRDAEEAAQELLSRHGRSGLADRAHNVLAQVHLARGNTRAAVKEYQTIVLYFPQSELRAQANEALTRLELQNP